MQASSNNTERVDYRATFPVCPHCGSIYDEQHPNCAHCNNYESCGWVACEYTELELEELARAKGITIHYKPIA